MVKKCWVTSGILVKSDWRAFGQRKTGAVYENRTYGAVRGMNHGSPPWFTLLDCLCVRLTQSVFNDAFFDNGVSMDCKQTQGPMTSWLRRRISVGFGVAFKSKIEISRVSAWFSNPISTARLGLHTASVTETGAQSQKLLGSYAFFVAKRQLRKTTSGSNSASPISEMAFFSNKLIRRSSPLTGTTSE